MTPLERTRTAAQAALRPPARLPLDDWIESTLRLPAGVSAVPGRVRLWPYQRGIAQAISDPGIERVTLLKPVRVGFTTLLTGAIGHFVRKTIQRPILCLLPVQRIRRKRIFDRRNRTDLCRYARARNRLGRRCWRPGYDAEPALCRRFTQDHRGQVSAQPSAPHGPHSLDR